MVLLKQIQVFVDQMEEEFTIHLGSKLFKNKRTMNSMRLNQIKEEISIKYNERIGNFEMIFPFNKLTEELAINACRTQNIKNPTLPNYTRMIINEIKGLVALHNGDIETKAGK